MTRRQSKHIFLNSPSEGDDRKCAISQLACKKITLLVVAIITGDLINVKSLYRNMNDTR